MANIGVQGKLVDENGKGIAGLTVAVFDVEVITDDVELGKTKSPTKGNGKFKVTYKEGKYGLEAKPDIRIRVYDPVKRLIYESKKHTDVSDKILDLGTITVHSKRHSGFLVTGQNKDYKDGLTPFLSKGNSIEYLIDNEEAWKRLTQSVENAKKSINILHLFLDLPKFESDPNKEATNLITYFKKGMPIIGQKKKPSELGKQLEKELLKANREKKVDVRIIVNDFSPDFFGMADGAGEVEDYFEDANNHLQHSVEIRYFDMPLLTPMHAKVVIIDSKEAFILGSPLLQEYYDNQQHKIDNPRRGKFITFLSQIKVPIHDVSMYVKGPAVADINEVFRIHWNQLRPNSTMELPPIAKPKKKSENISLQIVRTLKGENRFDKVAEVSSEGETGVLEAYLRAFRYAEDFIYLENQYFTCEEIANALLFRLQQKPNLQVIMLFNNKVDIPLYGPLWGFIGEGWQTNLIEKLLEKLAEDDRDRLGLFTSWILEPGQPKPTIVRNYIHSKVGIVDDKWATIGCANLDGVSLNTSQHSTLSELAYFGLVDYSQRRASEVNALIINGVDGQTTTKVIDDLRRMLWREHLGYSSPNASDLINYQGGWLKLWKNKASANLSKLKTNHGMGNPGSLHIILPFPCEKDNIPWGVHLTKGFLGLKGYLDLLGVDTDKLHVLGEVKSFSFEEGDWE